jgi:hypothetical protein
VSQAQIVPTIQATNPVEYSDWRTAPHMDALPEPPVQAATASVPAEAIRNGEESPASPQTARNILATTREE